MTTNVSEQRFEEAIVGALTNEAPPVSRVAEETPTYGTGVPGGYHARTTEQFDRELCLLPADALNFVVATQPQTWTRYVEQYGGEAKTTFVRRLAREIERRGVLDVLRGQVRDAGCHFRLAYFRPSSGLNPDLQKLHAANLFSAVRQLRYSERGESSLDLALFLNGIVLFTAEVKTPLTGQNVQHAMSQYQTDRDPKEPLFAFGRCLAHFAVDPELVYVTTHLQGTKTRFLPFNRGKFGGAGNPPVQQGYATAYLWEQVWARDSVLNLIERFAHVVEEEDDDGKRTGKRSLIFPRYHQLDAVRRLVSHARAHGTGQSYLIAHSAGSGKSNSIAWLAHQLSVLHDEADRRVFDSIVIVTDRRVLDRQLQRTVRQFEQTTGLVENIDKTSRQLREALEGGKTIIVTTLQKFPMIAEDIGRLPGQRFALIIDEAHSSQTGESSKSLKKTLSTDNLAEAEQEDQEDTEALEDRIADEMRARGRQPNLSTFAFTATPKAKTLELFGTKRPDGSFEPFSVYSMRQAIEEGFILDVLEHYTTYRTYWSLLKKIEDDPKYDRAKATFLLKSFVELHDHAIRQKVEVMVQHFRDHVAHRIGRKAKAMIVTRSRLHAVRTKLALDALLAEWQLPYGALVAFSGTVNDGGRDYTEAGMNGFPETQTADTFGRLENRFLVVASKFQTGFDQPLLHTMYVDKKLGGVHAVQTLSRLNRTHPGKTDTFVLDFANGADAIQKAFQPYYERPLLSEGTDPALLYDAQGDLLQHGLFSDSDVEAFATAYFSKQDQSELYRLLRPVVDRFTQLPDEDKEAFRSHLVDFVRLYAFLSQLLAFVDVSLEKLYVFAARLRRLLPRPVNPPIEGLLQGVDMDSFRLQEESDGTIELSTGQDPIRPRTEKRPPIVPGEELEPLSQLIAELNERFGTDFTDDDKVFVEQLEAKLAAHPSLPASVAANPPEKARLAFDHVATDQLQDMVDTNFRFYKRVTDDEAFGRVFLDAMFRRFRERAVVSGGQWRELRPGHQSSPASMPSTAD